MSQQLVVPVVRPVKRTNFTGNLPSFIMYLSLYVTDVEIHIMVLMTKRDKLYCSAMEARIGKYHKIYVLLRYHRLLGSLNNAAIRELMCSNQDLNN